MITQHVSALMVPGLVQEAMIIAKPTILALLNASEREDPFVHLVVLRPFEGGTDDLRESYYEETVPHTNTDRTTWKNPYADIAYSKAMVARRMKMDTSLVLAGYPALFDAGDTHYEGGVWMGGVAVGVSGVESCLDEAIARTLATAINALIKWKLAKARDAKQVFL